MEEEARSWSKIGRQMLIAEARSRMRLAAAAAKEGDCVKAMSDAGIVSGMVLAVTAIGDEQLMDVLDRIQEEMVERIYAAKGECRCQGYC